MIESSCLSLGYTMSINSVNLASKELKLIIRKKRTSVKCQGASIRKGDQLDVLGELINNIFELNIFLPSCPSVL